MSSTVQKPRTIVFLPMDAHGHTNAMLSLAGELKLLNYRTVFITNTTETPKWYGHELILLESQQEAVSKSAVLAGINANCEQDVFLSAKLFDRYFEDKHLNFNVDLADGARLDEISFNAIGENFNLWPRVMIKSRDTDSDLERLLIELRPELVVTEMAPIRPALVRLANNSYARKVAGWKNGLRWMQLMSSSPLWIYYFSEMASRQANKDIEADSHSQSPTPAPFLGLPIKRKLDSQDYRAQSEYFKNLLKSGGMLDTYLSLVRLVSIGNLNRNSLNDTQLAELFLNESHWLNVFMFPEELDYEPDLVSKLDKTRWFRVDSLIRPTSCSKPLDSTSERLLTELASWQKEKDTGGQLKVIYVSLGTVISENFEVMVKLMKQVFTCLEKRKQWRFAVSLGNKNSQIFAEFSDELNYWQNQEHRLLAKGWWPQPEVFKRHLADACVVHGGNNTICELFHYSPLPALVVVPGMNDQLDNARRLEELDYGVALPVGRLLRANYGDGEETMLLHALDRAIGLHEHNKCRRSKFQPYRRDARYCAQIISARLDKERSYWMSTGSDSEEIAPS